MDDIRTLPPLVRGKVTGFLDIFIDEVRIFRNILLLTDNCDIIVQVQWWGEQLPVYIIPKNFCSKQNHGASYNLQNAYFHSATYKIKTKLDLLKSYLKTCEVLELAVLKAVENLVIGSAFMKDLIRLINNIHEPITLPLVDSLGEEIGEVKIHTNFSHGSFRVSSNECFSQRPENCNLTNRLRNIVNDSDLAQKKGSNCVVSNTTHCERCTDNNKQKDLYESNQDFRIFHPLRTQNELPKEQFNFVNKALNLGENRKCENKVNQIDGDIKKCWDDKNPPKKENKELKNMKSKSFPEINLLSDSSKVLQFDLKHNKQLKNSKKFLKAEKLDNKNTAINFLRSKKKISEDSNKLSAQLKSSSVIQKNSTQNKKCVQDVSKKMCELHQDSKKEKNNSFKKITTAGANVQAPLDCQNSSVHKDNQKVLNYLLGYSMSKDDEESALNDLKRMSPSHNFVESINQLCTASENHSPKPKIVDNETPKIVSKKVSHLKFDLSNVIERNYFKKFFSNSSECSQNAFQIAEFLNPPKNVISENCCKVNDNCSKEFSHIPTKPAEDEFDKNSELKVADKALRMTNECKNPGNIVYTYEILPTDCSNCKYNKHVSELDTIIESLKHFGKKSFGRGDN